MAKVIIDEKLKVVILKKFKGEANDIFDSPLGVIPRSSAPFNS